MVSAGLGVHLEEVVDLPLRDAGEVADALAQAAELRAGVPARVDDPLAPPCFRRRSPRCVGDVAARTGADHLVFVRLIGGVTRIRILAERTDPGGRVVAEQTVNIARDGAGWARDLDRLAGALFPRRVGVAAERQNGPELVVAPEERPSEASPVAPWVVLGVGVASGAAGVAFGQSSASARDRIENQTLTGEAYGEQVSRMRDHGTAANVLFGISAGAILTGVVWLLVR